MLTCHCQDPDHQNAVCVRVCLCVFVCMCAWVSSLMSRWHFAWDLVPPVYEVYKRGGEGVIADLL